MNILIIGAGNIGERHIQALSKFSCSIDIIDPNTARLLELKDKYSIDNTYEAISQVKESYNIIIEASLSRYRYKNMTYILSNVKHDYFIAEKFLFNKKNQFNEILNKNFILNKTFVNCPMRTWWFYRSIKNIINNPFSMKVSGSNWGLGCNAIHYLDLFSYFLGDSLSAQVTDHNLNSILPAKRNGFVEYFGEILVTSGCASRLHISCDDADKDIVVKIVTKDNSVTINESSRVIKIKSEDKSTITMNYDPIFLSESSAKNVFNAYNANKPLVGIHHSIMLHKLLFDVFLSFEKQSAGFIKDEIRIT